MLNSENLKSLVKSSYSVRLMCLKLIKNAGSSHIGSCYSVIDILVVLYQFFIDKKDTLHKRSQRNHFILSKGHASAALYSTLCHFGFISKTSVFDFYKNNSIFSGHVSHYVPGIDLSTGSLGHGVGVSVGIALHQKLHGHNNRVFTCVSDGELNEGVVWESFMIAAHNNLGNLVVIVDYNKIQSMGRTEDTTSIEPIFLKFKSFNFNVSVVDGHSHTDLYKSLEKRYLNEKPVCIIANTVKGKGVKKFEDNLLWHYRCPDDLEYREAIRTLQK